MSGPSSQYVVIAKTNARALHQDSVDCRVCYGRNLRLSQNFGQLPKRSPRFERAEAGLVPNDALPDPLAFAARRMPRRTKKNAWATRSALRCIGGAAATQHVADGYLLPVPVRVAVAPKVAPNLDLCWPLASNSFWLAPPSKNKG